MSDAPPADDRPTEQQLPDGAVGSFKFTPPDDGDPIVCYVDADGAVMGGRQGDTVLDGAAAQALVERIGEEARHQAKLRLKRLANQNNLMRAQLHDIMGAQRVQLWEMTTRLWVWFLANLPEEGSDDRLNFDLFMEEAMQSQFQERLDDLPGKGKLYLPGQG